MDYDKQKVKDLQDELRKRGLMVSGKKSELVNRLRQYDNGLSVPAFGKKRLTVVKITAPDYFSTLLPRDVVIQIVVLISQQELELLCTGYPNFNLRYCNNEEFWKELYKINIGPKFPLYGNVKELKDKYATILKNYHDNMIAGDYDKGLWKMAKYGLV